MTKSHFSERILVLWLHHENAPHTQGLPKLREVQPRPQQGSPPVIRVLDQNAQGSDAPIGSGEAKDLLGVHVWLTGGMQQPEPRAPGHLQVLQGQSVGFRSDSWSQKRPPRTPESGGPFSLRFLG